MSCLKKIFSRSIDPMDSSPKVLSVEIMGPNKELVIFHHGKRYLLAENTHGQLRLHK
ncbi:MAG: hypothetical protein OQL19_03295 [Gammaproteobacteria bacterium]|nr:hypothetical protein [Gammaproteobacteria bacterium]